MLWKKVKIHKWLKKKRKTKQLISIRQTKMCTFSEREMTLLSRNEQTHTAQTNDERNVTYLEILLPPPPPKSPIESRMVREREVGVGEENGKRGGGEGEWYERGWHGRRWGGGGVEKNGDPKMVRWVGGGGGKKELNKLITSCLYLSGSHYLWSVTTLCLYFSDSHS